MTTALTTSPAVLVALRDLLSHHPEAASCGPEMLACALSKLGFLKTAPEPFAVEIALEALDIERGGRA